MAGTSFIRENRFDQFLAQTVGTASQLLHSAGIPDIAIWNNESDQQYEVEIKVRNYAPDFLQMGKPNPGLCVLFLNENGQEAGIPAAEVPKKGRVSFDDFTRVNDPWSPLHLPNCYDLVLEKFFRMRIQDW
jgi:hypothetical protein